MKTVSSQTSPVTPGLPEVRILKMESCLSLSGKSTLTYHVGYYSENNASDSDDSKIFFRVFANSGGGFFNNEWVSLYSILNAFAKVPVEVAVTSDLLRPIFQGKSSNTPAFLFAVIRNENLIRPVKDKEGGFLRTDGKDLIAEFMALLAANVNLSVPEKVSDKPLVKVKSSEAMASKVKAVKVKPGRR